MEREQPFLPPAARFKAGAGGAKVPHQLPLALGAAQPFSVDNYIIGTGNSAAFEMLESWPHWPGPITVLTGAESAGKSHLAAVWAAQSFAAECVPERLNKAAEPAAQGIPLLLEDADSGRVDETQLFHLINLVRQNWGETKQSALLITARKHPSAWNIRLADLRSRLLAANFAEITAADDILRGAILTKLFADRQLTVEPEVLRFILNRLERSHAALVRIAEQTDALALERKSKITRSLAQEALAREEERGRE